MAKKNNNPEIIDLGSVLSAEVNVPAQPSFSLDDDETEYTETITMDPAPEPAPEPAETIENEPEHGYMPPNHIAETIVNLLDGLQSTIVPYLREKKIFTEKELEILQQIDTSGGTVYTVNSPESKVLEKWIRHQDIVKKIPFDEGEKNRLVSATARYAETTQMKVSPFTGLMMAYSEVILKRSTYFFTE